MTAKPRLIAPYVGLIVAVVALSLVVAAWMVQRSADQAAVDKVERQNATLTGQLTALTDSLAARDRLTSCRVNISKTVDLAVLRFLEAYGAPPTDGAPPDTAAVSQAITDAIAARAATSLLCPPNAG